MRSRRAIPLAVASLAYVVALLQRPGELVADTKVNLFLDPSRFLGDVLSLWNPTTDLGHVWAGQYAGYAWPMAPWFALGDAAGLPAWLVHRLWLGTLLALAGWGVVRLLDALLDRDRGAVHAAAAVLFVINPYVTVYFARQSIALLAYASLPWLLLCVHRGLREPRGWRWPAAFALVLASAGGGVNAGLTGWVLLGPALLVIYDVTVGGVPARGTVLSFLARLAPAALLANLWWVVPLALASSAAPDFLAFTEQPGTIWGTTSLAESLRLMGFWGSYVGTGFGGALRPYQGSAPALLLLLPVVVAGLVTPALSLSAFVATRRWRYAPFFLLLTLVGLVVMSAGWPEGTPMRRVVTGVYYHVNVVQFLRTTYKAGALTALGIAGLGGAAFGLAWARWAGGRGRVLVAGGFAALLVVSCWPLVTGRAIERQLAFDLPSGYRALAADLDARPDATRAAVFPGQLFAFYTWGGTVDPVLPALTRHPVSERWIIPFADRRSSDLQFGVDALVTQERLRPGQLRPLLDLMGVGDVVIAADGDRAYSGEMPAADAVRELRGLGRPARAYGPTVTARPAASDVAPTADVPQLQRVQVPTGGTVRVLPRSPLTVVDGAAGAVAGLASYGALRSDRPLAYAPDLGARGVRAAARDGAAFVISDTNRRRAFVAARARGQAGPTLPAGETVSQDGTVLDPFGSATDPDAGARETVAVLGGGVRSVTAPASPQVTQFPEQRPFAALDGDPSTAWIADRMLVPTRPTLTVAFTAPRDVAAVDLMPYGDSRGRVRAVDVNGRRFPVRPGWNHLRVGLRDVRTLRVHLADVTRPRDGNAGAGGIRELRIPGVRATEALRPPTDVQDALHGADLSRSSLTYLLDRTTADVPFRQARYAGERGAGELRDARDPERTLRRVIAPPVARRYDVDAWAGVDPRTPDHVLDALVGGLASERGPSRGAALRRVDSSARFDGLGRYRGSGAFDGGGSGDRDWLGQWIPGRPAWLAWTTAKPVTVRTLALGAPSVRVRRPTRVSLRADGGAAIRATVSAGGVVTLPRPLTGRAFRLDVLSARFPAGTPARDRNRRAVGIGEIAGAGTRPVAPARRGPVALRCGTAALRAGRQTITFGGRVDRAALDAGRPLHLRACGAPVALPAGATTVVGASTALRVDGVRLASAAPRATPVTGGGRVVDAGTGRADGRDGVRVEASGPSWLVLGQSYDAHWKATCDGRDLGAPRPMQGYANAWPIAAGCHAVAFTYGLQKAADAASVISVIACVVLLALLLITALRRRRAGEAAVAAPAPAPLPGPRAPRPVPLGRAVAIALPVAAVVGLGFGLRAGAVAGPALVLILWRAVPDAVLARVAVVLLVVAAPLAYVVVGLVQGDKHLKANATKYPLDRIAGHWLVLAGLLLLVVILWRTLAAVGPARAPQAPGTAQQPAAEDRDPLPSAP